MSLFSMRDHDIYELVRELEGGESVWVKGEYGAEYKVKYEEGIYYVCSQSDGYTAEFDDIYEMQEYINFNFEEMSKILIDCYKG